MSDSKKSVWDSYRFLRKTLWISVLSAGVLAVIASNLPTRWGDYPALFAGLVAIVCSTALQHFKCPRCGKSFFYDGMWFPWRKNCAYCGLPKWEAVDYVNPNSEQTAHRTLSIAEMAADQAIPPRERTSKFLLLVLRDDPGAIHLTLNSDGWADVQNLMTRANRYGFKLTSEDLAAVIDDPEIHRFEWDKPGNRIRVVRD